MGNSSPGGLRLRLKRAPKVPARCNGQSSPRWFYSFIPALKWNRKRSRARTRWRVSPSAHNCHRLPRGWPPPQGTRGTEAARLNPPPVLRTACGSPPPPKKKTPLGTPQSPDGGGSRRAAPPERREPRAVPALALAIKRPTKRRGDNAGGGRGATAAGCPGDPSGAFRRYFLKKKHTHARQPR